MKRIVVMLIVCAALFLTGCNLTESAAQRDRRIRLSFDLNMRKLVEDWDYIWLAERDSPLTKWHPHVGY